MAAAIVLLATLIVPAAASAQDASAILAELKEAASVFNVKPGTFDPGAPSASAVAGAIVTDRIDNDGFPENFQVTEVYSITQPDKSAGAEAYWLVRYRTNSRIGAFKNPVYMEVVAYDPANEIPLGVGGFYSLDPWWSLQVTAAQLTGAGVTAEQLAGWIRSQPMPAGAAASAGTVAAVLVGLLGMVNGLVPASGSGISTERLIPPHLGDFHGEDWHWVYRDGKWQLIQGFTYEKSGWYDDGQGGREWHEAGEWVPFGEAIPGSIFDLPDPSLLGERGQIFITPAGDVSENVKAATDSLGDFLDTGVGRNLDPEKWKNLDDRQRSVVLKGLISRGARATGLTDTKMTVTFGADNDTGLGGYWDPNNRELFINTNSSKFDDPKEAVRVVFHELRHAAQADKAAKLGDKSYENLIRWNQKGGNYQEAGNDYTRYSGQLLERDANRTGQAISNALFGKLGEKK
ncbi:MAG: hypothetical protein EG823_02475 [Actinobacteria bacterium]|nr:hypothetical protein [Actinomycetota bacterium]